MPFPLICVPETTLQNGLLSAGVQTSRSANQGDRFRNVFCSTAAWSLGPLFCLVLWDRKTKDYLV